MEPQAIERFCIHLRSRNYSPHTVENYGRDLRLFFALFDKDLHQINWRDIDEFIRQQAREELSATTINRRLHALKHFFDYLLLEEQTSAPNPIKPGHFQRRGRPLPKKLAQAQVQQLFAQITNPLDHAMCLLMLRCGLRVSEVAQLKLENIDWEQQTLLIEQGKGRKDRVVYLSADTLTSFQACLTLRPVNLPHGFFFWNQKQSQRTLSAQAIQKKVERYARAAGVKASCHNLRHTFASNLLEGGAEIMSVKELLGHATLAASERYAQLSNQRVKQIYLQTMQKVIEKNRV